MMMPWTVPWHVCDVHCSHRASLGWFLVYFLPWGCWCDTPKGSASAGRCVAGHFHPNLCPLLRLACVPSAFGPDRAGGDGKDLRAAPPHCVPQHPLRFS